jgi:hypothetical protein
LIERGDNWWHIVLVTGPIPVKYLVIIPIGEIVDKNKLGLYAVNPDEIHLLEDHRPSTLAPPLYEVPADGYNSANRLLGVCLPSFLVL